MGNLPCCNPEEPHKPGAFHTSSNHDIIPPQGSGHHGNKSSFQNGNNLTLSGSGGYSPMDYSAAGGGTYLDDAGRNTSNPTASNAAKMMMMSGSHTMNVNQMGMEEERQKALYLEKERLQRIVNDASLNMVHVNGSTIRGMNAYYDPSYAADLWQRLLPGGNGSTSTKGVAGSGGGGLVGKCGTVVPVAVNMTLKIPDGNVPTGTTRPSQHLPILEKRWNKMFSLDRVVDRKHIATLNDILVQKPKHAIGKSSVTLTNHDRHHHHSEGSNLRSSTTTEEKIEILLEDLTERFMSGILSQQAGRQFEGVDPIIEHVL